MVYSKKQSQLLPMLAKCIWEVSVAFYNEFPHKICLQCLIYIWTATFIRMSCGIDSHRVSNAVLSKSPCILNLQLLRIFLQIKEKLQITHKSGIKLGEFSWWQFLVHLCGILVHNENGQHAPSVEDDKDNPASADQKVVKTDESAVDDPSNPTYYLGTCE